MSIGDHAAYPSHIEDGCNSHQFPGMSYRQWLIGMALQGVLASAQEDDDEEMISRLAIDYADAVLKRLDGVWHE